MFGSFQMRFGVKFSVCDDWINLHTICTKKYSRLPKTIRRYNEKC